MMKSSSVYIFAALVLLVGSIVWVTNGATSLYSLPHNFSFTSDIISVDNLYDEVNNRFSGESVSNTQYSYKVKNVKNGILEIENIFDVRKQNGEEIFTVNRLYGVDPKTGKHIPGYGDKNREGFLFGPQNADKSDFVYWHINYDTPITMKFEREENILGLQLYKYAADFKADQTKNLTNIPEVGKTRGINLDVHLNLWIEPQTGRMVKYQDSAIAYFYDLRTGVRQNPWNQFSNSFTFPSIERNVAVVQKILLYSFMGSVVLPGILTAILVFLLLFTLFRTKRFTKYIRLIPLVVVIFGIFISFLAFQGVMYLNKVQAERKFGTDTQKVITLISDRMAIYANGLRGAKGLFDASTSVERNEFKQYVENLDFAKNYPGVQAFGHVSLFPQSGVTTLTQKIKKEGIPDFAIHPLVGQTSYSAIIYIEPFDEQNKKALGLDMYTEPVRREAMMKGLESGSVQLSGKLVLVQNESNNSDPGFILYIPLYKPGARITTTDERKMAATGFVYNAYRARDLFGTILRDQILDYDVSIYDGTQDDEANKLFNSGGYYGGSEKITSPSFSSIQTVELYGHPWTFEFRALPGYSVGGIATYIPYIILVGGSVLSILLGLYLQFLISSQQRAIAEAKRTIIDVHKLQIAVESSSSHTIITDADGLIIYANKAAQETTGYSLQEMKGKTPRLWKSGQMPTSLYIEMWKTIKTERKPFKGEFINKRKNGEIYTVAATISPILEAGELIGFIGTEEDISLRADADKKLEEQKIDLERANKVMVERELKMIELKKEIQRLKKD